MRSRPHYSSESLAEFRVMQSWYVLAAVFLVAEAPLAGLLSFKASIVPMLLCLVGAVTAQAVARRHYKKFRSLVRDERKSGPVEDQESGC